MAGSIFEALFAPQAAAIDEGIDPTLMALQQAAPAAAVPAPPAGRVVNDAPMPPRRPAELGSSATPAPTTPPGNVLARLPQRDGSAGFMTGLSGGLANLSRTPDPFLAFAQGFGGSMGANQKARSADAKGAADQIMQLFKLRQQASKDARDERRLDADIATKRDANRIAERRVDAYREVGGGKNQSDVDADYKRSITRRNLMGEVAAKRAELGLDADDAETLSSRKLPKEERARREAELRAFREETMKMMPAIGPQRAPAAAEPEAPAQAPQRAPAPASAPSPARRALPEGMTPDIARQQARDAISAGRDPAAVQQRLLELGITLDD